MVSRFDELNVLRTTATNKSAVRHTVPIYEYFEKMSISDEEKRKRILMANMLLSDMLFIFALAKRSKDKKYLVDRLMDRYTETASSYCEIDKKMQRYISKISKEIVRTTIANIDSEYYTSTDRATNIAENESNTIMNGKEFNDAVKSGCNGKKWVPYGDERVRESHAAIDGVVVPINKPFHVGDSMMMYPKDDSLGASTEEIVGCRCSVEYVNDRILNKKLTKEEPVLNMDLQLFAEKDLENQSSNSLIRSIRKFEKRIDEHKGYIENPYLHCPDWDDKSIAAQEGLKRHWNKEIRNFNESIQNRIEELKKRGDYIE